MRVLFVHHNFPSQYVHLARRLADTPGIEVTAMGERKNLEPRRELLPGMSLLGYDLPPLDVSTLPPYCTNLVSFIHRGRNVAHGLAGLRDKGYTPDVILVHNSFGEAIFLKEVYPNAKVLLYCEFYLRESGSILNFDPEFQYPDETPYRRRVENLPLRLALEASDRGVAPTHWQRAQFPEADQARIAVVHDGVDTDRICPDRAARFEPPGGGFSLSAEDEVVTYVSRSLEPYRGFHVFMRAVPAIQRRRPNARIVVVGGDDLSYAPMLPGGETYRSRMMRELEGEIDATRLHFVGRIPYRHYLSLLRVSTVHVYLTYPFVLSWSLLEAMSAGCMVVGSRTGPVEEVIEDGRNGWLTEFFSHEQLAERVSAALEMRAELGPLRERARQTVVERYDLTRLCLPAQVGLVESLAR